MPCESELAKADQGVGEPDQERWKVCVHAQIKLLR
jgi:hypothetical protein